jgi:OOP family OmpA-OmpF porin
VLTVAADGTGRYLRTSLDPIAFDFDPEGRATDGSGWSVVVPPAPELGVADRFPPLGKLGSLAPPCAAVIRFDASLLFEFDEARIRPGATTTLDQVAAALAETDKAIEIHGHTDSRGSEAYNLDLSRRRAEAVEAALRERGLTVDISVTGYGESRPVAPNETEGGGDDPAGRALNRRVEIVIPE